MPAVRDLTAALTLSATLAGCAPAVLHAPNSGPPGDYPVVAPAHRFELQLDQGRLDLSHGFLKAGGTAAGEELRGWIDRSASAIRLYYGRFPVAHTHLMVEPVRGDGVQWARTFSNSGFFIRVGMGRGTSAAQLAGDWMLTHEFVHLALPTLADEHDWLQEGVATYVEPIARAQAGELRPENVWAEFLHKMPLGEPTTDDHGLDYSTRWSRTYWGGALFCLAADVEIRKQTDNRYGLRDALRGILEDGGTLDHRWTIHEVLSAGDRAIGLDVLTKLYEQWRATPVRVDLEALWSELGVERDGSGIRFDDTAAFANIRQAITGREIVPETEILLTVSTE